MYIDTDLYVYFRPLHVVKDVIYHILFQNPRVDVMYVYILCHPLARVVKEHFSSISTIDCVI